MGPKVVIIKRGEYGSMLVDKEGHHFVLPAYPTTNVKDPTGAGDSFAGALMGHLAQAGKADINALKSAMAYGTVIASFTIENFSLEGLMSITKAEIENRLAMLRNLITFLAAHGSWLAARGYIYESFYSNRFERCNPAGAGGLAAAGQEGRRLAQGDANWVRPEGTHLTLKFLGEIDEEKVKEVSDIVAQVASIHRPFDITVKTVDTFGRPAKVVWVGVGDKRKSASCPPKRP